MEQFYVVNSRAKSVRTDLALTLLRKISDRDPKMVEPQLLLQISGGPAAGQITGCDAAAFTYSTGPVTSGSSCHSTDKGGYWVGGGAEYAILSNLHLKLEYYYMDFGTVGTNTQWTDTTGLCTPMTSNTESG